MINLSLQFAPGDMAELNRQMERRNRAIGRGMPEAIKRASIKVLVALRASTKIAPKMRRERSDKGQKYVEVYGSQKKALGYTPSKVVRLYQWRFTDMAERMGGTRAKGTWEQAKAVPFRGLARDSIGWMMAKLYPAPKGRNKVIQGVVTVKKTANRETATIAMTNRLSYIMQAFKTNGKQAVATAMRRAANMLRKETDRAVGKMR